MANFGAGLDAVKDAIGFYMELRQQKEQDRRLRESDSRAQRTLDLAIDREAREREDRTFDNERAASQFMATNYGGSPADQATVDQFKRSGLGGAIEDHGLPSRSLSMPVQPVAPSEGMASPLRTIAQNDPGGAHIRMPESERARIAYYQTAVRTAEGAANRGSREGIAAANRSVRLAAIRASINNAAAARELQRYGIDVRDATSRAALEERMVNDENLWADRDIDNQAAGGVVGAILRSMQNGMMPPVGRLPGRPTYYDPPPMAAPPQAPAAGGGSGRYDIERLP